MINFSVNKEYSISEEEFLEAFAYDYEDFIDVYGTESVEDFLLHMIETYGPDNINADEEYMETVVF